MVEIAAFESAARSAPRGARGPRSLQGKRAIDLFVAVSVIIFFAPLLLLAALAIYLESDGPVLFRQKRGGLAGEPFTILKLRTMTVAETGDQITQAIRGDVRITRVGAFLRRTSIDELPQLINVIRGEMSLVGPRPHALAHDREFASLLPAYSQRFQVKPGITGLAQVRGCRGPTRSTDDICRRTMLDLEYIHTWSIQNDLKILLETLKAPFDSNAF